MNTQNVKDLNEMDLSILREVCNIGSGNALRSLYELTKLNLDIDVPTLEFADFRELPIKFFNSEENIIATVSQDVEGDLDASLLLGIEGKSMELLLNSMQENFEMQDAKKADISSLDETQLSMVSEIGSILCGSYISALSDFIQSSNQLSAPVVAIDMSAAVISQIVSDIGSEDKILLIGTNLSLDGNIINAKIILLPKKGALDYLIDSVQKYYFM